MIAKIAVSAANFAIDKSYSYRIPEGMTLSPGSRVVIPFGRGNRRCEGIVLSVEEGTDRNLKTVEQSLDPEPLLSENMLHLAAFMRERYFCTFYDAARVMLPGELWFRKKQTMTMLEADAWKGCANRDAELLMSRLADLGGSAGEEDLRAVFPDEQRYTQALHYARSKKWIREDADFRKKASDKTEQVATLASSPEEAMEYAAKRPKSAAMQREVLTLLCSVGTASVKEISYYTGAGIQTIRRLAQLGYLTLSHRQVLRTREIVPDRISGPLTLNGEQQAVFCGLKEQMDQSAPGAALLYGVTGSGKTAVYLKLIQHALDRGQSAVFLVPEIALTPQLLSLLAAHFGSRVAVIHSNLSPGERYDGWRRIRSGDATVVVGTRSAVFVPAVRPGLFILDEEQEHSYASEASPRYDAREIALWRGSRENALVLFGSATPRVETMYRAKTGIFTLYTLKNRYNGRNLPQVEIVDMRRELELGNDLSLSVPLRAGIRETADCGKQTILFLNRRGNSRALICVSCRKSPECPRCSARLTYHSANNRLMCHHCGFSRNVPETCPECGGPLKQMGCGTQKVQQELESLMPDLKSLRMDTDTVNAMNTHERILDTFRKENIPVLIGTQLVAKGLNLPNVTLVGVLDADMSLYADSFRAAENTFNMLTQVVGRAGRGDTGGTAVIQTLVPEHRVITLAAAQDYDGFYDMEIRLRRAGNCPPFGDIAVVTFTGENETAVLRGAAKFRDSLLGCLKLPEYEKETCTVLGPAPCPVPKINYHYRYRLMLHGSFDRPMRRLTAHLLRQFSLDKANRGVSAFVDVNGSND